MAYDVHIVKSNDFLRLDARGNVDIEKSRTVLTDLARECVEKKLNRALLDVRDVRNKLQLTDLYSLARAFHEMGFRRTQRLAVLHRYSEIERAEFFAMCAADQGFDVGAFDDFEAAMDWLNRPEVPSQLGVQ